VICSTRPYLSEEDDGDDEGLGAVAGLLAGGLGGVLAGGAEGVPAGAGWAGLVAVVVGSFFSPFDASFFSPFSGRLHLVRVISDIPAAAFEHDSGRRDQTFHRLSAPFTGCNGIIFHALFHFEFVRTGFAEILINRHGSFLLLTFVARTSSTSEVRPAFYRLT